MISRQTFVADLESYVAQVLARLDLVTEPDIIGVIGVGGVGQSEIVRRLKIALKNELEASELAAFWMPSTPEVEIKLALARQVGDEAKHYRLIENRIAAMGADLSGFNPMAAGYSPMFQLLAKFNTTVERIGAAQFAREALALKKNEQFIEFCEAVGDHETAELYRGEIQPDEQWHVQLGRTVLKQYADTDELRAKARIAVEAVLDLAVKIQNKQVQDLKVSHAPGC